jgi:succinate dehydrogenase (ubiquinone) cytochrome b560 subunit
MLARTALLSHAARRCALAGRPAAVQVACKSGTTVSGADYLARKADPYTVRQEAKGRFVSPHVAIYAFPTAALASITMRGTGVGLAAGFYGVAAYALVGGDVHALLDGLKASAPLLLAGSKFCVGFPLSYHFISGLRHLYIDRNPGGLTNESIEMSSRVRAGAHGGGGEEEDEEETVVSRLACARDAAGQGRQVGGRIAFRAYWCTSSCFRRAVRARASSTVRRLFSRWVWLRV